MLRCGAGAIDGVRASLAPMPLPVAKRICHCAISAALAGTTMGLASSLILPPSAAPLTGQPTTLTTLHPGLATTLTVAAAGSSNSSRRFEK